MQRVIQESPPPLGSLCEGSSLERLSQIFLGYSYSITQDINSLLFYSRHGRREEWWFSFNDGGLMLSVTPSVNKQNVKLLQWNGCWDRVAKIQPMFFRWLTLQAIFKSSGKWTKTYMSECQVYSDTVSFVRKISDNFNVSLFTWLRTWCHLPNAILFHSSFDQQYGEKRRWN